MATGSANVAYHGTLSASTVDTITVAQAGVTVEVINRTGTAEIYFTVNGATPTVGAADTFVVPSAVMSYVVTNNGAQAVVRLISSGAEAYSVVGAQPA